MRALSAAFVWLKRNFWQKLLSVVFAVAVWLWASGWVYNRVTRVVPVTLTLAPQMTVVKISPPSVEVVLQAPGQIMPLGGGDFGATEVVHDLTEAKEPGRFVFNLSAKDVRVPFRAALIGVNPSQVTAEVDRLVDRVLPVRVVYSGRPSPGYRIAGQTVTPPEVLVPGPQDVLKTMIHIETEPINVAGRKESFPEDVRLRPVSSDPAIQPKPVRVRVEIEPELQSRVMASIPVSILRGRTQTDEVGVSPAEVKLSLKGQQVPLQSLLPQDVRVYIDISGLTPGTYQLPLQNKLPSGIVLEKAEPEVIKVTVGQVIPTAPEPGIK